MAEDIGHLIAAHSLDPLHQVIGLGQDLLDSVLNAVVNGLDQVSGSARTDVCHTGTVFHLCRHLADKAFDRVVGGFGAPRHHAGTLKGALRTARNTHADETEALAFELLHPSLGVLVVGIASINQKIPFLQQRG